MGNENIKPEGVTSKSEARRIASLQADEQKESAPVVAVPETNETVVVSKKDLEGFLKRLEGLENDNKRLIAVADKGRMANLREKEKAADGSPLIHTVRLTRLSHGGPLVVAWKMIDNQSYVDGNRSVELQTMQVVFQDGTTEKFRLVDFYRNQDKTTIAEIISRRHNRDTEEDELEVELRDGERITIPLKFVN